jgi:hypothetical protein
MYAMTAGSSAFSACATCGVSHPTSTMLFGAGGHVCPQCDADASEKAWLRTGIQRTILGGPAIAFSGTGLSCVASLVLGPIAPLLWLGFGAACFVHAVRGVLLAVSLIRENADRQVSTLSKALLFASAGFTAAWGTVLLGLGTVGMLGVAMAFAGM